MTSQITTSAIIKNQWSNLLKHFSSGKIVWKNVFLHALLPVMLGAMYGYLAHNADGSSDMTLFGVLAAIIAVIGTIMLKQVIVDTAKMNKNTERYTEVVEHLLGNYLQTNIHYVLIVAFITIMLIIAQSALVAFSPIMLVATIVSSIIVSLIMHMMLIMMVILKQFRVIYKVVYIP